MNDLLLARARAAGGIFTATDALACGYDRPGLSRLVTTGQVVRIGCGAYAEGRAYAAASPDRRHRMATTAALRRFPARVAASHYSALTLWGLPVWRAPLSRIHLARTVAGPGRRSAGVTVHRGWARAADPSAPSSDAYDYVAGALCVRPALAVLGTAMICGVEAGVVAADAALAADLISGRDLQIWLERIPHHPSVRAARLAVDLADERSESPGESRARLVLGSLDLGTPRCQVEIRTEDGFLIGRVDFLYEQQRTVVEFDGLVKYGGAEGRQVLVAEKRREDLLRDLGYEVVRVTWAELDRPLILRQRLLAAFGRNVRA
jgi:hypothetical protein